MLALLLPSFWNALLTLAIAKQGETASVLYYGNEVDNYL